MRVLHLLATDKYSGAENVACQIINIFKTDKAVMVYCSPQGTIEKALRDRTIEYLPLKKLTLLQVKKAVKHFKPDIIHAHDIKASVIASFFHKKCKVISHIHGNNPKMSRISLKSLLYKIVSKRFRNIFFVSESCFKDYIFNKEIEKKSKILYNIVNREDILSLASQDGGAYKYDAVYVGRFTTPKNPQRLVKVAALVAKKYPEFKLCAVGSGVFLEECIALAGSLGVKANIDFKGYMDNPYKVLSQAKFFIMTSIYEGTPMVAMEAFALGIPIISTAVDGLKDIIKDGYNGFLCQTDESFLRAIKTIMEDKLLLQKMSKGAVETFDTINDIAKYKQALLNAYTA